MLPVAESKHTRGKRIVFGPCSGWFAVANETGFVQIFDGRPR